MQFFNVSTFEIECQVQIDVHYLIHKNNNTPSEIISSHCELLLQQVHFFLWLARVREQLREDGLEVEVEPT